MNPNRTEARAIQITSDADDHLSGSEAMMMMAALSAVVVSLLSFTWL